jgi:hypothetical protein
MRRRSFLTGLIAAMAAPSIARADNLMPISTRLLQAPKFWGDGIHCDAAAIQWALDHAKGGTVMPPAGFAFPLRGALIKRPLRIPTGTGLTGWDLRGTGTGMVTMETGSHICNGTFYADNPKMDAVVTILAPPGFELYRRGAIATCSNLHVWDLDHAPFAFLSAV